MLASNTKTLQSMDINSKQEVLALNRTVVMGVQVGFPPNSEVETTQGKNYQEPIILPNFVVLSGTHNSLIQLLACWNSPS